MKIKVTPNVSFMRSRLFSTLHKRADRHGGRLATSQAVPAGLSPRKQGRAAASATSISGPKIGPHDPTRRGT
jgi:hypothetical protein